MHVAIVVFGTLGDRSGGFRYDHYLLRAFEDRGHTVSVISQDEPQGYRGQHRIGGEARWVSQAVTISPDLLLIDELNHAATLPGIPLFRAAVSKTPIVAIVHHLRSDEVPLRIRSRAMERRFLRSVDGWICNSTVTLRRVQSVSGVQRSSAVVFPAAYSEEGEATGDEVTTERSGIQQSEGPTPGEYDRRRPDRFRALLIGNMIPRKKIHLAIDAILRRSDTSLDVFGDLSGDPRYTRRLQRMIGDSGDRIQLHGRVPQRVIDRAFEAADLFILPSSYEGFGIVYLEALRRGVPVIATRRGGASDIVVTPAVGRLVAPRRRAVRRAIDELLRDRSDQIERGSPWISTEARRVAQMFPSWEAGMAGAVRFAEEITRRFERR